MHAKQGPVTERHFGIVQGRLSVPPPGLLQWFPQDNWWEEFSRANALGIRFIELLTERQYNNANPAWSVSGRNEIRAVASETGCDLYSICTDYIIDHALLGADSKAVKAHVYDFLDVAADLKCKVAVFPLLEQSNLTAENALSYVPVMKEFATAAARCGTKICIESLLPGADLKNLLERIDEPDVKCVFDTGNRVVENRDLASEIRMLGSWIDHVHIKDKTADGENVLLGRGLVDFRDVFMALNDIGYRGPLVFETTRGTDPVVTAAYHMNTCKFFAHEAIHSTSA